VTPPRGTPEAFKKVVPDALSAEDWFRFHGRYANGESIVPEAFVPQASVPKARNG